MQHMDSSNEMGTQGWQQTYDHYEGAGQKIKGDDDELFASMLVRKMKDELANEQSIVVGQRLALAIVSICAVVILFGLMVLALALGVANENGGIGVALGWGFVMTCIVIIVINGYFHSLSHSVGKTSNSEKNTKREQKNER